MKKLLLAILISLLVGTTSVLALATIFSDIPEEEWYFDAITNLTEKGIVEGYEDNTFRPENNVNRAEIAVMLNRLFNYIEKDETELAYNTVSFMATADPDTRIKEFGSTQIGTKQSRAEDLNELLRPSGNKMLIVTTITGYHILPTAEEPFSIIALMACTEENATRGWGTGGFSITGEETTNLNYDPGIVVSLIEGESICIGSFNQSNDKARIGVQGYLVDR